MQDDSQLVGFRDAARALKQLRAEVSTKVIRQAALSSVNPVVKRMRERAPRGTRAHRTYRGRLVAPGFLSRSIRKRSQIQPQKGRVQVTIGLQKEAFYGLFYDRGYTHRGGQRFAGDSWFASSFIDLADETTDRLRVGLRTRINKVKSKTR